MKFQRLIFFTVFIALSLSQQIFAQTGNVKDTTGLATYTIKDLLEQVQRNHPLIQAANLQTDFGDANKLKANGSLDPYLSFDSRQKTFDGKNYYSQQFFELDLFSASPLSANIGIENTSGIYNNNESSTPVGGLGYIGLQLPLLKNLITDQRRTQLKQAAVIQDQSVIQKRKIIQEIHSDIWNSYIQWYVFHEQTKSLKLALDLSNERQFAQRKLYFSGGCSGFDTLEIAVQRQLFEAKYNENEILTLKTKIMLNAHLWSNVGNKQYDLSFKPISFKWNIVPTNQFFSELEGLLPAIDSLNANQPDLELYAKKIDLLKLDLKLKQNNVLPKLDLKYQYLNTAFNEFNGINENQRFGVSFATPIYFRSSRAEVKEFKLKLFETQLSLIYKKRELELKSSALFNQIIYYRNIYNMLNQVENGYFQLYQMEIQKFNNGDGTIFILNSRETRYLESKIKTLEQYGKLMTSIVEFLTVNGRIDSFVTSR